MRMRRRRRILFAEVNGMARAEKAQGDAGRQKKDNNNNNNKMVMMMMRIRRRRRRRMGTRRRKRRSIYLYRGLGGLSVLNTLYCSEEIQVCNICIRIIRHENNSKSKRPHQKR